jgi:hypothetical protein
VDVGSNAEITMASRGMKGHTTPRGREAGTGQFIPVKEAQRRPSTTVVERVPKAGYGAESSSPRGRDAGSGQFVPIKEAERRPATTVIDRVPHRKP